MPDGKSFVRVSEPRRFARPGDVTRAASLVISDDIYAMLLTRKKINEFTTKQIADTSKTAQILICISQDLKGDVRTLVDAAA